MKRFLLLSAVVLAMGHTAYGYLNNAVVQVPPMDPALIQIDDPKFVNNGRFVVDLTLDQDFFNSTVLYETTSTRNYTNNGTMIGVPGFDFENFPATLGQAQKAASFVNNANGFGGGQIYCTNIFFGANVFQFGGLFGGIFPPNFELVGLATFRVRATNIINSGLVSMDNTGLIDLFGDDVDLRRGRLEMTGANGFTNSSFGVVALDSGFGTFGTNTFGGWFPFFDLTPTTALSPIFADTGGNILEMFLTNATPYFENLAPTPNANGVIVWRGIYLQDNSPSNVIKNVYFDSSIVGEGAFHIEWVGPYRDPLTGGILTNYFYLSDVPVARRTTNFFFFNGVPEDFSFTESTTTLFPGVIPAAPGYVNPAPPNTVTNDFSFVNAKPTAVLVDTNLVVGGNPTNLPGRVQLTASHTLNLANVRITGPNYVSLNSPFHFLGNSNALITAPYSDLRLGVTNGSLTLTNLLVPQLPAWSGVPGAPSAMFGFGPGIEMGGIQAWSGSYIFVDANGITNDVRMLLVNSALQPTSHVLQQDVILHDPDSLTISDELNIFRTFSSDATVLTLTTNDNSAFSLTGQLNLLSDKIFWSASLPNLKYLTNWGQITTLNLANFAGNMLSPFSDPDAAIPYEAFVNHGNVASQGVFIRANYFENTGIIQESQFGNIDIVTASDIPAGNGSFVAPTGNLSITGNSLFASNGVMQAGGVITLTTPCFLSDGYIFGNQFAHFTDSNSPPNVVTNGNQWSTGAGIRITTKPATGDLLGTTITNTANNGFNSINQWPGDDRGCSPEGFTGNLALGRMVLDSDAGSQFTFVTTGGNNALYVDSLELRDSATNTTASGDYPAIVIEPGMKIYFAEAKIGDISIAEKLNGKNGGGFCWVSNYAGVFSSTNVTYLDGDTFVFNEALVVSPNIDSDNDGIVNRDDLEPISTNVFFDITPVVPIPCDNGGNPGGLGHGGSGGGGTNSSGGSSTSPGTLSFPTESGSATLAFALAQGSYNGLFYETNGVKPASSGYLAAKVTSKGGFSAKLQRGTGIYSFSGQFDNGGHASSLVSGKGLTPLTVQLQLVNNDRITGSVSGNGWSSILLADRTPFSSKNPTRWAGKNTLVLPSDDENSTTPVGDAFGTATISSSGGVQWSGVLPDGTKVTQKSALSKNGIWPVYSSLYGGAGSFIGWMQCTNHNGSDVEGSAVWIMPAGSGTLYPSGLTNQLDAIGSGLSGSLGFSHGVTVFSGGNLNSSLTNNVTIFGKAIQSPNGTLKLSVNPQTGLFNGSVTDPNSGQNLLFQGALVEKSGIGGGFFLNADKSGKVYFGPAD